MSTHATDPDAIPDVGMTWNRLGMLRTPSKLIVHGRLVQDGN